MLSRLSASHVKALTGLDVVLYYLLQNSAAINLLELSADEVNNNNCSLLGGVLQCSVNGIVQWGGRVPPACRLERCAHTTIQQGVC